eukprot:252057-Rhodomonas_salina.6
MSVTGPEIAQNDLKRMSAGKRVDLMDFLILLVAPHPVSVPGMTRQCQRRQRARPDVAAEGVWKRACTAGGPGSHHHMLAASPGNMSNLSTGRRIRSEVGCYFCRRLCQYRFDWAQRVQLQVALLACLPSFISSTPTHIELTPTSRQPRVTDVRIGKRTAKACASSPARTHVVRSHRRRGRNWAIPRFDLACAHSISVLRVSHVMSGTTGWSLRVRSGPRRLGSGCSNSTSVDARASAPPADSDPLFLYPCPGRRHLSPPRPVQRPWS